AQHEADRVVESLLEHGVNHIDVAPSYDDAELRLGPWLETHRDMFFLGCKTLERSCQEAREELHGSLERLRVDRFDLYQLHGVTTMDELDRCFAPGGAMEAVLEAREAGLTRYIGITSHGLQAPAVELAALERFDFDSVLFPLNGKMWSDAAYRRDAELLLKVAAERDVGTMVIKALARGPWGDRERGYHTWYEPFDEPVGIGTALRFVLSQPVSAAVSSGDARLLPMIIEAAESFEPMATQDQDLFTAESARLRSIFD
ncbi:aldo/keto reductase, partial [Chloroflexota bacterium]